MNQSGAEATQKGEGSPSPAILTRNLHYTYPDGTTVLRGVSMEVGQGECTILLGANGSGKSTLLLNLAGILFGRGDIEIMGNPLTSETVSRLRSYLGLVFQNPDDQLFCPTVFDDVAFGPLNMGTKQDAVRSAVDEALAVVGLPHFKDRAPHRLSFGEKKRIAIASVLSMDPSIVLMDEPTSSLDPRTGSSLIDLIFDLRSRGKTVLIATHDLHLASEVADTIIILGENGCIAAEGGRHLLEEHELLQGNNLLHVHRHGHGEDQHSHHHFHGHEHDHENHKHENNNQGD